MLINLLEQSSMSTDRASYRDCIDYLHKYYQISNDDIFTDIKLISSLFARISSDRLDELGIEFILVGCSIFNKDTSKSAIKAISDNLSEDALQAVAKATLTTADKSSYRILTAEPKIEESYDSIIEKVEGWSMLEKLKN